MGRVWIGRRRWVVVAQKCESVELRGAAKNYIETF